MGFTVRPAALRELEKLLARAKEDVGTANAHLVNMEHFAYADGALAVCLDGHRAAYRTLSDWLGEVADPTLTATTAAVADSAAYYERTDTTTAANLDATYPDADVAGARERAKHVPLESEGTARFADVTEPAKHLGAVKDYTDEMEAGALQLWDMISPSSLLNQAIEGVSEVAVMLDWLEHSYNPYEHLAREFVGEAGSAGRPGEVNAVNQPANLTELLELTKGTRYESIAGNEQEIERLFVEEMTRSSDPMIREIGSGIADGTMTWHAVATSSAYAEQMNRGLEVMRDFDLPGALGALAEQDAPVEKPVDKPRREPHEDDDLFTGGLLRKRRPR
ncbi:hypothetical protein [Actinophytocola gossypii]|uniref:WXG100 family type VII secretion target n=1 Tax=Actinophytocola gossypii TaxID=2812003 RepID=A0ABT2JFT7_9PSEU|nr:hypothetical protein [Actinophytocola gossypii]MCT2586586.1 hypothetical protein [Actinophytocola gossypii]